MKYSQILLCFVLLSGAAVSQNSLPRIQVHPEKRYLQTADGQPFFWLGDTAWELFHRLNREEAVQYLETRRRQGFNLIQAVALAEFDGLRTPNAYGDLPLQNLDPERLATTPGNDPADPEQYDYWDHVDFIIETAAAKGLYFGLLPAWGDKVAHLWGDGPIIFNEKNARTYGKLMAERYAKHPHVVWILGGDRPAVYKGNDGNQYDDRPVWRSMAAGILEVAGANAFITYHCWGGENSTSQYVHDEDWMIMNTFQSGHGSREAPAWDWVERDWKMTPPKPVLDMEPCYEDHPVNPWDGKWTRQRGYFFGYDVRARIYRGVFAGGSGVTYGNHFIWQFCDPVKNPPINNGDTVIVWQKAVLAEAAGQLQFLKKLMQSRPYFSRMADQGLILFENGKTYVDHIRATRDAEGTYAMVYLPENKPVVIDLDKISGEKKKCWWFDPRTGKVSKAKATKYGQFEPGVRKIRLVTGQFNPPQNGKDWVLVIDDASKKYPKPGR